MTVAELIKFLKKQPQDYQVAYELYSEYCHLESNKIKVMELCTPRSDGWIHRKRPDKLTQNYLVFPGN